MREGGGGRERGKEISDISVTLFNSIPTCIHVSICHMSSTKSYLGRDLDQQLPGF